MSANISPLAQTFFVDPSIYPNGVFLTSIDLFFSQKLPAESQSVSLKIVQTLNGYPTDIDIQGSSVIVEPANVNTSTTATAKTNFKFKFPVGLNTNTTYAIVVYSNSAGYKVWTATMGQPKVDNPSVLITSQPALGSFFKSQNNSTWTPNQLQDLTFILNRAKFDTSVIGTFNLVEAPVSNSVVMTVNPFALTSGQTKVKVTQYGHNLVAGMQVVYSGSTDTQFNGQFTVASVADNDHYVINTPTAQTTSDHTGGGLVVLENTYRFSSISLPDYSAGANTNITVSGKFSNSTSLDADYKLIPFNQPVDLGEEKYVMSSVNKTSILAGANSVNLQFKMSTADDTVSPFVNLTSLPFGFNTNKINNPTPAIIDQSIDGSNIVVGASNVSFDSTTNKITVASTTDYSKIVMGAYIKVVDTGGSNDGKMGYISAIDTSANTLTIVGDSLVTQSSRSATIIQYTSYISEIANHGTTDAKFITVPVTLPNICSGFRILVDLNVPTGTDINLYFRSNSNSSATKLSDLNWIKMPISYQYSPNMYTFTTFEYGITNVPNFNSFQFKFVFLSNNYMSPKIANLRIVAHA